MKSSTDLDTVKASLMLQSLLTALHAGEPSAKCFTLESLLEKARNQKVNFLMVHSHKLKFCREFSLAVLAHVVLDEDAFFCAVN